MRVLFYGSFSTDGGNLTPENLSLTRELAKTLVLKEHTVVTREGIEQPAPDFQVVDNPALEGAVAALTASGRGDLLESICDPVHLDQMIHNKAKRRIIRAPASDRFAFYRTLMDACDVVCIVGGAGGADRVSLIARFSRKPILPLGASGGVARQLWSDLTTSSPSPYAEHTDQLLRLGHLNMGDEFKYVENAISLMQALVKASERPTEGGVEGQTDSGPKVPERLTLAWLAKTVPIYYWVAAIAFLGTTLSVGAVGVAKLPVVQQLLDVSCIKVP